MRVNVDTAMLSDPRYEVASGELDVDPDWLRMKMIRVYHYCTDRGVHEIPAAIIMALVPAQGCIDALARVGLIRASQEPLYYVAGTRGRIEWLARLRTNSHAGGDATRRKHRETGEPKGRPPTDPEVAQFQDSPMISRSEPFSGDFLNSPMISRSVSDAPEPLNSPHNSPLIAPDPEGAISWPCELTTKTPAISRSEGQKASHLAVPDGGPPAPAPAPSPAPTPRTQSPERTSRESEAPKAPGGGVPPEGRSAGASQAAFWPDSSQGGPRNGNGASRGNGAAPGPSVTPTPGFQQLVGHWYAEHEAAFGVRPGWIGKEFKYLKKVLEERARGDVAEVEARVVNAIRFPPWRYRDTVPTPQLLFQHWDQFGAPAQARGNNGRRVLSVVDAARRIHSMDEEEKKR